MLGSGRVEFFAGCEYLGRPHLRLARRRVERFEVPEQCRIVDARYLAPDIPAETPPRFAVADGARVIPVNDLVRAEESPSQYVVVGSGKTATDACVWLLQRGRGPRRDLLGAAARAVDAEPGVDPAGSRHLPRHGRRHDAGGAAAAPSLHDLFLRLEDAGIMLRIDRSVTPTMAKAPTLGIWELELLRTIENVVRRGHIDTVRRGRIDLADGSVAVADDALVVNCAADGLKMPPLVPIWRPEAITLQPVRAGFPCFGAALAGYVEATRDDDAEKNRLCAPSSYGNTLADWATDERPGHAELDVVRLRARHQGVVRPGRAQPRAHPTRARRVAGAGRRGGPPADPRAEPGWPGWLSCSSHCRHRVGTPHADSRTPPRPAPPAARGRRAVPAPPQPPRPRRVRAPRPWRPSGVGAARDAAPDPGGDRPVRPGRGGLRARRPELVRARRRPTRRTRRGAPRRIPRWSTSWSAPATCSTHWACAPSRRPGWRPTTSARPPRRGQGAPGGTA